MYATYGCPIRQYSCRVQRSQFTVTFTQVIFMRLSMFIIHLFLVNILLQLTTADSRGFNTLLWARISSRIPLYNEYFTRPAWTQNEALVSCFQKNDRHLNKCRSHAGWSVWNINNSPICKHQLDPGLEWVQLPIQHYMASRTGNL